MLTIHCTLAPIVEAIHSKVLLNFLLVFPLLQAHLMMSIEDNRTGKRVDQYMQAEAKAI